MKYSLILAFSTILALQSNNPFIEAYSFPTCSSSSGNEVSEITLQDESGSGKMLAIVFKNQEYCRAELKDFEFDAEFKVLSATVYFSGANFKGIEKGYIKSNKLEPIADLMKRCTAGSNVMFDDVKVIGPDNKVRTIRGASYMLF